MSELSYEPNTIKNGHLAQTLGPLKGCHFTNNGVVHMRILEIFEIIAQR